MNHIWERMEAPATDARSLHQRTNWLVLIHLTLAAAALAVMALVIWRIRHLITLAQRSNVETLVIAFVFVFLLYMLVTTAQTTIGSLRILWYRAIGRERAQRALQRKVRRDEKDTKLSYLNVSVRGPDGDVELPIEDRFGKFGTLRLHLAEVAFVDCPKELTHSVTQVVVETLKEHGEHDERHEPKVIFWDGLEEGQAQMYSSEVAAFDRLERAVGKKPLWPTLTVDEEGVEALRRALRDITPELRENLLIPDVEYSAEFSIPIVPEPFAFFQLRRRKEHADAVASMGCATIMAVLFLAAVAWVIVDPPWVPGK